MDDLQPLPVFPPEEDLPAVLLLDGQLFARGSCYVDGKRYGTFTVKGKEVPVLPKEGTLELLFTQDGNTFPVERQYPCTASPWHHYHFHVL